MIHSICICVCLILFAVTLKKEIVLTLFEGRSEVMWECESVWTLCVLFERFMFGFETDTEDKTRHDRFLFACSTLLSMLSIVKLKDFSHNTVRVEVALARL